jgi:hypothetical protein
MEGGSERCDINQNVSKAGKNNKSDIHLTIMEEIFLKLALKQQSINLNPLIHGQLKSAPN